MRRVLYLGDTALPGPASYLAGILTHSAIPFVHVPSDVAPAAEVLTDEVGLFVLSDYPSVRLPAEAMARIVERVRAGAGLLMLGGWESYHGLGGDWDRTPVADLLPVHLLTQDDRRNWAQVMLVRRSAPHPIVNGLPFHQPPSIGGYNEFRPRTGATVVLEGERYRVGSIGEVTEFCPDGRFPLLVVKEEKAGPAGAGRRACLATDVAPHWIGGMVDWGEKRLSVKMGADFIEVGQWYAEFFRNLVLWTLGQEERK